MFMDARHAQDGSTLRFDLAIVGAGMAGITLASQLRDTGQRICLIEGGGIDPALSSQRMLRGESVGREYFPLDRCRFRVLGGSSTRWGGWCRPLEPDDFTQRDWMPLSGWPINYHDLAPFYSRAAALLGLESAGLEFADWADRIPAPPPIGGPELEPAIIQHSERIDFGEQAQSWISGSDSVTALLHANVIDLRVAPGTSRLGSVAVTTDSDARFEVEARTFVLAAGGIENARLLLAARSDRAAGLGNESDFVGRCFMEHLHVHAGYIASSGGDGLPPFFARARHGGAEVRGMLQPTAAALRARGVPTSSFCIDEVPFAMGPAPLLTWPSQLTARWSAAERRARRKGRDERRFSDRLVVRSHTEAVIASQRLRRLRTARDARRVSSGPIRGLLSVYARGEQSPNRASRVTLGSGRDASGMPRARLDWQVADSDVEAIQVWMSSIDASLRRRGHGEVLAPAHAWQTAIVGGPHHLGTTRMSARPEDGVVDADCRVHTVDNLYVAGGSVFTTGGHANPAMTILALTVRLADHLRAQMNSACRRSAEGRVPISTAQIEHARAADS